MNNTNSLDLSALGFKLDQAYSNQYGQGAKPAAAAPVQRSNSRQNANYDYQNVAPKPTYQQYKAPTPAPVIAQTPTYRQAPASPLYRQQTTPLYRATTPVYKAPTPVYQAAPSPVYQSPKPVAAQQVQQIPQQPRFDRYDNSAMEQGFSHSADPFIRKLGQNEKIFHGTPTNGGSYIFRAAIVSSEIDLYRNLNIVKEAIDQWKLAHPLLRARVIPRGPDKFFAFADEEKIRSFENVKFLHYKSNSATTCDEVWKMIVEKETTQGMDGENGLLWRLTFFQLRNKSTGEFQYAIIIAFDHSIMDGRCSYGSLLELMSIIEGLYTKNFTRLNRSTEVKEILPPKEELFASRHKTPGLNNQLRFIKAPAFVDLNNSIATTYIKAKNLSAEEETRGMVYHHDGRQYAPVSALIQVSKLNNSKFRTLTISKPDMGKLLAKCRENGCKMTSCLNLVNALAIRMIHEKLENFAQQNIPIQYVINVSLREMPEYKSYIEYGTYDKIGCYIGLALSSFEDTLSIKNPGWAADFWNAAKEESADFHKRLERGDFIHPVTLPPKRKEHDEFFYHFGNSNLGVMENSITEKKLIKIRKAFATGKYSRDNFLCWYSNLISTVDGEMCWTISYNTYFIKQELIDMLIENCAKILWQLAQVRIGTN